MSTCRSCGKEIIWIKMKSGKSMPVDPYKHTVIIGKGNETLVTQDGNIIHGKFASYEEGANASGYVSHFSTCPFANEHRRSR